MNIQFDPTRPMRSAFLSAMIPFVFLAAVPLSANADEGQPVAIRYWPANGASIETMWNLHIAIEVDSDNRKSLPRLADVEFVDDFWAAVETDALILDRKPNEKEAELKPANENTLPSSNAVRLSRVDLKSPGSGKSLSLNIIAVDGVTIADSNKHSVADLIAVLHEFKELPKAMESIDAFLTNDIAADQAAFQSLQKLVKARVMILRQGVKFEKIGEVPVESIGHNTFAVSKSSTKGKQRWIKLAESSWPMDPQLGELFAKKEAAAKASRAMFAELSSNQMNFKPANGTHTPRWNAEHMMGRELLFFSQIYHAVDPCIPIMDLNPKQKPGDYKAAHDDWSGLEESMQMERVEAFTRRFAYMLEGMDLNKKAKGSAFWSPQKLLKQMEAHYNEHTANVVKKKDLPDWPKE